MTAQNLKRAERIGPGRLSAEETALVPERLMDAALGLFMERGYAETTMDEIARKAGASTKTLYSRFSNKADILHAVVRRIMDRTVAGHAEAAPAEPHGADPQRYLASLCGQICMRIATEAAGLNRLAHVEGQNFPEFKQMHDMATARGTGLIRAALSCWRDEGRLPRLGDLERTAALCLSMTTDWTRIRTSLGDPPGAKEIERHVGFAAEFFLRGCGYDAKAAPPAPRPKAIAKSRARRAPSRK
jgi:TetR/AcrR family transcriptional regulator, mexJK operon transcriptional repressor